MYEQSNRGLTVHLPKELDHHAADEIRKEVDRRIMNQGMSAIYFDFSNTTFMDSSGIGLLMGRYKMVSYVGGQIVVMGASEKITSLLRLANVHKYVTIARGF